MLQEEGETHTYQQPSARQQHHTLRNYQRQFKLFLCFSIRMCTGIVLSLTNLISFLEFLLACHVSPSSISNYVSAIKGYLSVYNMPTEFMGNSVIINYIKALYIQIPHVRKPRSVLLLKDLLQVSTLLDRFDYPLVYMSASLLSFYGFLRISTTFDFTRQLLC